MSAAPYEPFALWDMSGPRYERIATAETLTELWKRITAGHVVIEHGFKIVAFHDDMLERVEEWSARAPWH